MVRSDVSTGYFFVINCRPQLQTAADIRPADCSRLSTAADWRSCIFYPRQPTGRQKELVLHKQVRHSHPDNTFNIHSSRILLSFYGQEFQGSCWSIGVFHIPYSQCLVFIFLLATVSRSASLHSIGVGHRQGYNLYIEFSKFNKNRYTILKYNIIIKF